MKDTVLLLDAQTVQTLIIARSLNYSGYNVVLFCDSKSNYGYYTKYADQKVIAPSSKDEENYVNFLINYIKNHKVSTIIPLTDDTALILSKYLNAISNFTRYIMPNFEIFQQGYDKNALMTLCACKGYPHPRTIDLSKIEIKNLVVDDDFFPALIKPNYTAGGRGMVLVHNMLEFYEYYPEIYKSYGNCHLQQFIPMGGKQFKVQLFIDRKTETYYSSVIHKQRFYPENGGSSCCNVTIRQDALVELCKRVLNDLGWMGFADFDLIEDPRTHDVKVMEINPRIPACIKSAILSGIDYATIIADTSLGKPLKDYMYVPGKKLRHIGFDVLWFIYSKNRLRTKPSWFRFIDKDLSFQDFSWRDPLPFFIGTWANIKRQLNPEFRKQKSGLR